MPTKAFIHLDSVKQNKLLEAAKKEFSNNLFENASINKIIKEINMPRGSFYLYFENKEDIYLYILDLYLKKIKKDLFEILKKNDNDIFKSIICFYDYLISNDSIDNRLVANLFINMNSKQLEFAIPELLKKEVDGYLKDSINFSNYYIDDNEKDVILSIIFPLLFANVGKVLSGVCDKQKIRDFYIKQINIIKRGLERN